MFNLFKWLKGPQVPEFNFETTRLFEEADQSFKELRRETEELINEADQLINILKSKVRTIETRFDAVGENIDEIVVLQTSGGHWTNVNTAACKLLKIRRSDVVGFSVEEIVKQYPHLKNLVDEVSVTEKKAREEKTIQRNEVVFISPDSLQSIPLDISVIPILSEDKNTAEEIVVIAKENLANYNKATVPILASTILDQIPVPVVVYGDEMNPEYVNKTALQTFKEKFTIADIFTTSPLVIKQYCKREVNVINVNGVNAEIIPVLSPDETSIVYNVFVFRA